MIQKIYTGSEESILDEAFTGGLGRLTFRHPIGTFSLTPASKILLRAIAENQEMLRGIGIDWGTGIGCQAILAAKIDAVDQVYGLEIAKDNVDTAVENAAGNEVDQKVRFILADSYSPIHAEDKQVIEALKSKVDFILSNPPSSDWDDGFGFRRMVLSGAKEFLKEGGIVLLNISFQYGMDRIHSLCESLDCFRYMGIAASTACEPFDLARPDLLDCLKIYAGEERKGGMNYTFLGDMSDENHYINARAALENFEKNGRNPYSKWQTHRFRYQGQSKA